jgi:hypothetical protein
VKKAQAIFMAILAFVPGLVCRSQTLDMKDAPRPGSFPLKSRYNGEPASPILQSKRARLYRTVIREGAKQGPNFAGHYTVVAWGCGLASYSLAVVDAISGSVYFPPFECVTGSSFGLPFLDQYTPAFRMDSQLLAVYGQWENDSKKGIYFYRFVNGKFKLIHFAPEK